ncbi:MAG TPA: carboxypeptidase-like regulatory domain-containing protein [Candidatus Obscuribacterales bacterium]
MTTSEVSYSISGGIRHLGLPVAGVTVILFEYWRLAAGLLKCMVDKQTTGARGEFKFSVPAGTYYLEVVPDASTRFLRQTVDNLKVASNTTCNISLKTGNMLSGCVRTSDGSPLAACRVLAMGVDPPYYRASDSLDADSRFKLVLPKGRYLLIARYEKEEAGLPEAGGARPFIYRELDHVQLEGDDHCQITLPELVRFGVVITRSDGSPVPGARVSLTPEIKQDNLALVDLRVKALAVTDPEGKLEFLVQPGTYDLVLQSPENLSLVEVRERSLVLEADCQRSFVMADGMRLSGKVLWSGQPVRGCLVKASGSEGKAAVAVTGALGEFALVLPPGTFDVAVGGQPNGGDRAANLAMAPWTRTVHMPGDEVLTVDLAAGLKVSGRVEDPSGKPRPGVRVSAYPDKGGAPSAQDMGSPLATTVTSADGGYLIGLSAGKYWLVLNDDASLSRQVELANEPVTVNFTWSSGCVVRFTVVNERQEPIGRCKVLYEPYAQAAGAAKAGQEKGNLASITGFAFCGDDGTCEFTLPAGIYSFRFEPPAYAPYQTKVIRQLSIGADLERTVKLSAKEVNREPADGSESEPAVPSQLTLEI